MSNQERIKYWDILKGIAIILVVFGHSNALSESVFTGIYSFHMPLFMIISGYFFYFTIQKRDILYIIKNKTYKTLVPIVLSAILIFVDKFDSDSTLHEHYLSFYGLIIHTLWFLWAILIDSILVLALYHISIFVCDVCSKNTITPTVLFYSSAALLSVLFILLPNISVLQDGVKFMFPCFVFGFSMNQLKMTEIYKRHRLLSLTICVCLYACLLTRFEHDYLYYYSGVYIFSGLYPPMKLVFINIYRFVIGVTGSLALMMLLYEICQKVHLPVIGNSLANIGQHTLGIYIVSIILNYYWLKLIPSPPHFLLFPLIYTIGMLIVSYFLTTLYASMKSVLNRSISINA